MSEPLSSLDALERLVAGLTKRQRVALTHELEVLRAACTTAKRGDFWQDPERRAKAQQAMRDAWERRRARGESTRTRFTQLLVSERSTGLTRYVESYEEAARFAGKSPGTVRTYVSRGGGRAHFAHNDEIITIERYESVSGSRVT